MYLPLPGTLNTNFLSLPYPNTHPLQPTLLNHRLAEDGTKSFLYFTYKIWAGTRGRNASNTFSELCAKLVCCAAVKAKRKAAAGGGGRGGCSEEGNKAAERGAFRKPRFVKKAPTVKPLRCFLHRKKGTKLVHVTKCKAAPAPAASSRAAASPLPAAASSSAASLSCAAAPAPPAAAPGPRALNKRRSAKGYTKEEDETILSMRDNDNSTFQAIADVLGRWPESMKVRYNVLTSERAVVLKCWTRAEDERVYGYRRRGLTLAVIGTKVGKSANAVIRRWQLIKGGYDAWCEEQDD